MFVYQKNKLNMLAASLQMYALEAKSRRIPRTLVFVASKRVSDMVARRLCEKGIIASSINSDRSQAFREDILRKFRKYEISVLVTTDVCARGLDIKELDFVRIFLYILV